MSLFKKKADKQPKKVADKSDKEKTTKEMYKETEKKSQKKGSTIDLNSRAYRVLIKPIVTEKASDLGVNDKYVFMVDRSANKIEVAKAITKVYGIKPEKVNLLNFKGKKVRRGRTEGKRKDWKKAVVTLPKGKTINVYEGV